MAFVAGQKLRVSDMTGGSGGGGVSSGLVVATADTTVNNTTSFSDVTGLSVPVVANATYAFSGVLFYTTGTAPDCKYQPSTPSGTSGSWSLVGYGRDVSPVLDTGAGASFMAAAIGTALTVAGDSSGTALLSALVQGSFTTTTSGTFKLRVGQRTATASNTISKPGSWVMVTRV